ncbi:MAG: DsbA family protein [Patescibacteria group bacterium]|jgi:protein-disulfide isomerase
MNEFFKNMNPKTAFIAGVVGGIMAVCTVGFIVLLSQFVNGKTFPKSAVFAPSAQKNAVVDQPTDAAANPAAPVSVAAVTDKDHIRGDVNASIVVVEYSDTECPFCKQFHATMEQLYQNNKGTMAWVYRHFPLASLHSKAPHEAEATECAGELGGNDKFWAYLDEMFNRTGSNNSLPETELPKIATAVGLNEKAFNDCLASGRYTQKVQSQYDEAVAAGGSGTPYSVIIANGQNTPVNGAVPLAQLQTIIDSAKAAGQK